MVKQEKSYSNHFELLTSKKPIEERLKLVENEQISEKLSELFDQAYERYSVAVDAPTATPIIWRVWANIFSAKCLCLH